MSDFTLPVLAIESSCDETAAAVVVGRRVLSNVIASQAEMHAKWGGVVPEAAARAHVEAIVPVVDQAISNAGLALADLGAVAVTNRPGLVGALSVGVTAAKAIALSAVCLSFITESPCLFVNCHSIFRAADRAPCLTQASFVPSVATR